MPELSGKVEGDMEAETTANLICPRCQCSLDVRDRGRAICGQCREEESRAYRATMGGLFIRADAVRRGYMPEAEFLEQVDPEIRHLGAERFGHPCFSMSTWARLVDWLDVEHRDEGKASSVLRSRVGELLRPHREPASSPPHPVVASRRHLNVALGVSATNPGHLEKRARDGELTFERRGQGTSMAFAVVMSDPGLHAQLSIDVAELQGRRRSPRPVEARRES